MVGQQQPFMIGAANFPVMEAYRAFRTNIQYANPDRRIKTILFTSAGPGEGKSVSVANVGSVLAQSGKRVIIVDGDLRKPAQHEFFNLKLQGLANVLRGECKVADVIQATGIDNLWLVASGTLSTNPSELLGSGLFREALDCLGTGADYVIIDSAPVLPYTDACVMAPVVDGVVLVLKAGAVSLQKALKTKEALELVHGQMLGVMVNKTKSREDLAHCRYYGA